METAKTKTTHVRACNSHDELLEALRDALCELGDIPESNSDQHLIDVIGKGWDAIAKAEGK